MKNGRLLLLVVFCLLILAFPFAASAQNPPLVAFVNSSGQLGVSSADGGYRWIITNPGETLAGDFTWSPAGDRVYFPVGAGADTSVRAASITQQAVAEVGRASGDVLSVSPDGNFLFAQQNDGSYSLQPLNGGAAALPLSNDRGARYSGMWSNAAPLVAYWGYAGNSTLAVTSVSTGQTLTLDSGRSAPITPLIWLGAQLIFRDASGIVRLADLSCMTNSCGANPLESATALASADADVATDGSQLYFRSGSTLSAVNLACGDTCASSAVTLAANAAPQTAINAAGGTLVYTGYQQNPNDPNDRQVNVLNLGCVNNPSSCAPQIVLTQAVAGSISSDGRFAVAEIPGGLVSLDLSSGATGYLSDKGAALANARWQP